MARIKGKCEPARSVIVRLGGVTKTSEICGCAPSSVSRWMIPNDEGGSAGSIPQKYWHEIVQYCNKSKIKMDIYDLSGIPRA